MSFLDKLFKKEVSNLTKNIFSSQTLFGGSKVWTKRDFYYGVTFSCIDAIATAVASTNLELYRIQKGDDIEIDTHPSLSLLTRPNDFQTGVDLVYQLASHIHTAGKAVLYPVRTAQGIPVELWALDPTRLQIVAGEGFVKGYVYINPMGVQVPFLPTELILIYRPNPYNAYEGVSTIEMSRRAIEADLNAQDFNSKFFENGANPSGILSTAGTLNENSFTRLRRQFEEKYEGKQNAYKTMVLEGGLSYTQVQLSQKDMDFVAQRNMSRDEIMSIFRVPKTILAITDDVNRANAETSNYVFSARTVKPMLDLIVEKLNRFYIPMFNDKTIELRFENPIPEDKEAELKYDTASVNNWETVNEVRSRHGLEPVEGGDELQAKTPDLSSLFGGGKDDKDDSKNEKKVKAMITKSVKDKRYLFEKKKKQHEALNVFKAKVKQHLALLTRDVEKKSLYHKRIKGIDDSLLDIMPDIEEWKSVMATITIKYEQDALQTSVDLLNKYYDFPEVDLKYSGILGIIKDRANGVAYDAADSILARAREVIAQKLDKDKGATLKDLRNAIVEEMQDTADYRAERIAKTEMSFAFNEGAVQDMKSSGVVEKVKRILGDDACDLCQELVGVYDINDVPAIPTHPNCECDVVPYWGR